MQRATKEGRAMQLRKSSAVVIAVALAAALFTCHYAQAHGQTGGQTPALQGSGRIYLVPLGEFPMDELVRLADYYRERFSINIATLPGIMLDPSVMNTRRGQADADRLIETMRHAYPDLARRLDTTLIGVTTHDMYIEEYSWQFAFALGESTPDEGQFAVVSNARMNPVFYHEAADPELLHVRLRKMVTKQIGVWYFGLSPSSDPRSVLYQPLSIDELDNMTGEF
jgi:predicted Zn-dependent protease